MTESKMIRILSSYEDMALFEIIDRWDYNFETNKFTNKVRDIVLLSEVIDEFRSKAGDYYQHYHVTSLFRDLIKLVESGKSTRIIKTYDDTCASFNKKWDELHPGVTYNQWQQREAKRLEESYKRIAYTYFPWECSAMPYHLYKNRFM